MEIVGDGRKHKLSEEHFNDEKDENINDRTLLLQSNRSSGTGYESNESLLCRTTSNQHIPRTRSLLEKYGHELLTSLIMAIYGASGGCILGFSSPTTPDLKASGVLTVDQVSWYQSLTALGSMAGALLVCLVVQVTSRKTSIYLSTLPQVAGWLCIIIAPNTYQLLYIGRFLTGVSGGQLIIALSLYLAEAVSKDIRGAMGMVTQLGVTCGILIVYSVGMKLNTQWLAVMAMVPIVAVVVPLYFLPESPRWLIMKHRRTEAICSLRWFRNSSEIDVLPELEEIERNFAHEQMIKADTNFRQHLSKLWRPMCIGIVLFMLGQFVGYGVVLFNVQEIFAEAGWEGSPAIPAIIIAAVKVVCVLLTATVVDRYGRRVLIIGGGLVMAVSSAVMGFYFYYEPSGHAWITLVALILYMGAYAVSWGTVPWIFIAESIPLQFRGWAPGLASIVSWLCAFVLLSQYVTLLQAITWAGLFWIFSMFALLGMLFAITIVPETSRKSLETIEHEFLISTQLPDNICIDE